MPVTQSERNFAGLLVHGGVGIGLVWFLDDLDATHNANPEGIWPDQEAAPGSNGYDRMSAAYSLRRAPNGTGCSRSIERSTSRRPGCNTLQVSWLSRPRHHPKRGIDCVPIGLCPRVLQILAFRLRTFPPI
jgi:hypothetical protein